MLSFGGEGGLQLTKFHPKNHSLTSYWEMVVVNKGRLSIITLVSLKFC
jgi:hypothetical protein